MKQYKEKWMNSKVQTNLSKYETNLKCNFDILEAFFQFNAGISSQLPGASTQSKYKEKSDAVRGQVKAKHPATKPDLIWCCFWVRSWVLTGIWW